MNVQHDTDVLIIGSGIAGLSLALQLATHARVTLVSKGTLRDTNTIRAQGGIAAAVASHDSIDAHIEDTIAAGEQLCDPAVVRSIISSAPQAITRLVDYGVAFTRHGDDFALTREGGHRERRILHAADQTGHAIMDALIQRVQAHANITVLEQHMAIDLITERTLAKQRGQEMPNGGHCYGCYVLDQVDEQVHTIRARVTCLATGGMGKLYRYTTNPHVASGDGLAMAYRAGASLANLEFVQFHPTCLFHHNEHAFLISEALRGEGGILRLVTGEPFMHRYDARQEMATRDIVARAIDAELKRHGHSHVMLDVTHLDPSFMRNRFPQISQRCLELGLDITQEAIPVIPAAHYSCGGVTTDLRACTSIPGLLACGEVAHTGLHGANRLASNSLMEAAVMAERAADAARTHLQRTAASIPELPRWDSSGTSHSDESVVIHHNWDEVRRTMWNYVGIVRSDKRLARAAARIALLQQEIQEYYWNFTVTRELLELRNLALVAELMIRSAQARRESRGLHYTIDCPGTLPSAQDTTMSKWTLRSVRTKSDVNHAQPS